MTRIYKESELNHFENIIREQLSKQNCINSVVASKILNSSISRLLKVVCH